MLNREKFEKEILDIVFDGGNIGLDEHNKLVDCRKILCSHCQFSFSEGTCAKRRKKWFDSEYIEPEIDWSKVPVDTPILVRSTEDDIWKKRYFSKYTDNDRIEAWLDGATSWNAEDSVSWKYAKLARKEDELLYSKN